LRRFAFGRLFDARKRSARRIGFNFLVNTLINETMRNPKVLLSALLVVVAPRILPAQLPTITPERQAAVMEMGRLLNEPARFVLQHRTDLALSDAQVSSLEQLAAALRDSSAARMARSIRDAQKLGAAKGLSQSMEWSGPIDEGAIRAAMRKQSEKQAELMIASARDRRLVAAVLTAEQRAKLPQLQLAEMTKAARTGSR
jgi:Spy/CpxP family protein refolding chaperone